MGEEGLIETIDALDENNIGYFGAGLDQDEAGKVFVEKFYVDDQEFTLALIGAFEYSATYKNKYSFYADDEKSGVNELYFEHISKKIKDLKEENPNAFVVVFPHWGNNYQEANVSQKNMAHYLITEGADMIIGHGSHMMQEVEKYNGKWIFYSLGNFVFNSPGRYQKLAVDPYSLMAELVLSKALVGDSMNVDLRLYPVVTDNLVTNYQGRFVVDEEFDDISKTLNVGDNCSDDIGQYIDIKIR